MSFVPTFWEDNYKAAAEARKILKDSLATMGLVGRVTGGRSAIKWHSQVILSQEDAKQLDVDALSETAQQIEKAVEDLFKELRKAMPELRVSKPSVGWKLFHKTTGEPVMRPKVKMSWSY